MVWVVGFGERVEGPGEDEGAGLVCLSEDGREKGNCTF